MGLTNCNGNDPKPSKKATDQNAEPAPTLPPIGFAKEIQPILEGSCLSCHSEEKQKGDINLQTKEAALSARGNEYGKVIITGNASVSGLIQVLNLPADDDYFMPAKGEPLTAAQTLLLIQWINEGAHWPEDIELVLPEIEQSHDPLDSE